MKPSNKQLDCLDRRGYYWNFQEGHYIKQYIGGKVTYKKVYGQNSATIKRRK